MNQQKDLERRVIIIATHICLSLFIESELIMSLVFYYEPLSGKLVAILLNAILIVLDFIICGIVLKETNQKIQRKLLFHLPDLVLLLPSYIFSVDEIVRHVLNGTLSRSNSDWLSVSASAVVLFTSCLSILERILLIRQKHFPFRKHSDAGKESEP